MDVRRTKADSSSQLPTMTAEKAQEAQATNDREEKVNILKDDGRTGSARWAVSDATQQLPNL